jgi:hypothetical protein
MNDDTMRSDPSTPERHIKRAEKLRNAKKEERRMARKLREFDFEDDDGELDSDAE